MTFATTNDQKYGDVDPMGTRWNQSRNQRRTSEVKDDYPMARICKETTDTFSCTVFDRFFDGL